VGYPASAVILRRRRVPPLRWARIVVFGLHALAWFPTPLLGWCGGRGRCPYPAMGRVPPLRDSLPLLWRRQCRPHTPSSGLGLPLGGLKPFQWVHVLAVRTYGG
jgi:hypothetical protein